tara:strand:- start:28663 stop:29538 length:876 start_codon:yes stop_codon:yes gene_type:complete
LIKKKLKQIPVSIVIPTLGYDHLQTCINKINVSSFLPKEVLIIVPKDNFNKIKTYSAKYKNLKIRVLLSKKKNQIYQRILGFKRSKTKFVMQLDDDVQIEKNCLYKLYQFVKKKKNICVAPRYTDRPNVSKIYRKPTTILMKIYHWLINSDEGFSPGKISQSGFNYSEENRTKGFKEHEWLSGGIIIHYKKNLILKNYYPYKFHRSYCEDVLHSLILRKKGIKLLKYFEASASTEMSGSIVIKSELIKTVKHFYSEFLIRQYIVRKFKFSKVRLIIYYLILFLRILIKLIK